MVNPMANKASLFLMAVAALFLTGCPSDDASAPPVVSSSGTIVYLADQTNIGVFELFLATSGTKLNSPLVAGGSVKSFALTPDATAVIYIADQEQTGVFELWRVNLSNPGVSTKLNGALATGGDVEEFAVTPNSNSVVYIADQSNDDVFEIFQTVLATGVNSKLNPPYTPPTGQDVDAFVILPDSTGVVYRADQDPAANDVFQLYVELFATPGTNNPAISGVLGPGQSVKAFATTSDNQKVVYIANRPLNSDRLFAVPTGGGASIQLNTVSGTNPNNANVTGFAVTPNGLSVVYRADQDTDEVFELYSVPTAGSAASTKLNGPLASCVPGPAICGDVMLFNVIPDNTGAVYIADQNANDVFELFRSQFSGTPPTVPLNPAYTSPPFTGTEDVEDFALFPNGAGVVYRADQDTDNIKEIYRVVFGFPGSVKLNPALTTAGQNVETYTVSPDSGSAIYRANQDNPAIIELYRVQFSSPGVSAKLNTTLVAGTNVKDFAVK